MFKVESPSVVYTENEIVSHVQYSTTDVKVVDGHIVAVPKKTEYVFKTDRRVPKVGVMLVGWGGNNGTTVTGAILANKLGLTWTTKEGVQSSNYFGSLTQASTIRLGSSAEGDVWVPFHSLLPMVNPNDLLIDGWDISAMSIGDAMKRAEVFEFDLQRQLYPHLAELKPRPSIYYADFIAANQSDRADNVLGGTKWEQLEQIRADIRDFKAKKQVDKVIVLWTANTERFSEIIEGVNDTADNLLAAIKREESEVAPSTVFAIASILEGCSYINGSPQNTFVPGVVELAEKKRVFIGGDDFKSGQPRLNLFLLTSWLVLELSLCQLFHTTIWVTMTERT